MRWTQLNLLIPARDTLPNTKGTSKWAHTFTVQNAVTIVITKKRRR